MRPEEAYFAGDDPAAGPATGTTNAAWDRSRPPIGTTHRCVQHAGDAIFVPRGWGHAVVNAATGAAIAVEFHDGPCDAPRR